MPAGPGADAWWSDLSPSKAGQVCRRRLAAVLEEVVVVVLVLALLAVAGAGALALRRIWTATEHPDR